MTRHTTPNTSNLYDDPGLYSQRPGPLTPPRNQGPDIALQRGLAPEALEHPSEYPNVFEAARKIVLAQRVRYSEAVSPNVVRWNPGQSERNKNRFTCARRNMLYQPRPFIERAPWPQLSSVQEISLAAVVSLHHILMFAGLSQTMGPGLDVSKSFTDVSTGQNSWFTAAYTLALGVCALISARLGDTFGRKYIIVTGSLCFALWSFFAGLSPNVQSGGNNGTIYFCFCRAMQGISSALCVPNGFYVLEKTLTPGQKKDTAFSLFSAGAPVGFVIGTIMTSLFAVNAAWEWSFFVLAAVCVSAAGLSLLVLPGLPPPKPHFGNSIWVQLDLSGMLLGGSGLILFSVAWNQAPAVGWRTPYTYFLLLIGVVFFAAFVYNERVVVNPLLPWGATDTSTNLVLSCTAAGWGCFIIWAFYSFQFLEVLRDWDPLLASAGFVPVAIEGIAVALLLAYLMPGVELYWTFLVSVLSFLLASILMATASPEQTYWANTFVSSLLVSLGMVMASPIAITLLRENMPEIHQGIANSLVLTVSGYAMSLTLGIARIVEDQVNQGGEAVLHGFRGAQYFGVGIGGLGVLLATAVLVEGVSIRGR